MQFSQSVKKSILLISTNLNSGSLCSSRRRRGIASLELKFLFYFIWQNVLWCHINVLFGVSRDEHEFQLTRERHLCALKWHGNCKWNVPRRRSTAKKYYERKNIENNHNSIHTHAVHSWKISMQQTEKSRKLPFLIPSHSAARCFLPGSSAMNGNLIGIKMKLNTYNLTGLCLIWCVVYFLLFYCSKKEKNRFVYKNHLSVSHTTVEHNLYRILFSVLLSLAFILLCYYCLCIWRWVYRKFFKVYNAINFNVVNPFV